MDDSCEDKNTLSTIESKANRSLSAMDTDLQQKINEIVYKDNDNKWTCRLCGKKTNSAKSSDIRRHAEIHIEGLSFNCTICDRSFRSRASLKSHRQSCSKL